MSYVSHESDVRGPGIKCGMPHCKWLSGTCAKHVMSIMMQRTGIIMLCASSAVWFGHQSAGYLLEVFSCEVFSCECPNGATRCIL